MGPPTDIAAWATAASAQLYVTEVLAVDYC